MKATDKRVKEFQGLPTTAMPSIRYVDDEDAWMYYPSDAIREAQRQGRRCEDVAGSAVEIRADRDGWREWATVE